MRTASIALDDKVVARFWRKVQKGDGCWEWQGYCDLFGYGKIRDASGRKRMAHRMSWTIHNGPPGGMGVLHRCDNPPCVRPDHLFLGSKADNNADMVAKGRGRYLSGEALPQAALGESDVWAIRVLSADNRGRHDGISLQLAILFDCAKTNISKITTRRTWKQVA